MSPDMSCFPPRNSEVKQMGAHFSVVSGHSVMFAKHLETSSKGICSQNNTSMSSELYPVDPEGHQWCGKGEEPFSSLQENPEKTRIFRLWH